MTGALITADLERAGDGATPFPSRYGRTILFGWVVIALSFGGLALWSVLAPLGSAAIAQGTVVVDGARKSVQHLDGGIIREILVRDGDAVEAGELLIQLDDTLQQGSLELIGGRLDADRAAEARLIAERNGRGVLAFPADLVERAAASADVRQMMAGQAEIFRVRAESLAVQLSILKNRIEQSKVQIEGLEREQASKVRQADLLRRELDALSTLLEKGHAAKNKVLAIERELEGLEGARGEIDARVAGVRQAIGEAELQIAQLHKTFLENVEGELREIQDEIFELTQRADAAREEIGRTLITAPAAGVVVDLAVHTVGGVIGPGSRILDIVPGDDQLVVEARVLPTDISDIREGQSADLRFPAFKQSTMPAIQGTILMVSADRLVDPRTDAPYYLVRVAVPDSERQRLGGHDLLPGMPVEVILPKGEHTLADYMLGPITETFGQAFRE